MANTDNSSGLSSEPPGDPVKTCGGDAAPFDPSYSVDTMPDDLVKDPSGVYGYMPTPGTEFADTAKWPDWTNPEAVAAANLKRIDYHQGLADKAAWVEEQRATGLSDEAIARQMVDMRNAARMAMYTPEQLPTLLARNLKVYKNANGPSYEMALEKEGGNPSGVIASALRSNKGVDVLCGVCTVKEPGQ